MFRGVLHSRRSRRFVTSAVTVAAILSCAGQAQGATVSVNTEVFDSDPCSVSNSLNFAGAAEANKVIIEQTDVGVYVGGIGSLCSSIAFARANAVVSDTGARLRAGRLCTSVTQAQAECRLSSSVDASVGWQTISLGGGADSLALNLRPGVWADLIGVAAGFNRAVVQAGAGNDTLRTSNGAYDWVDCGTGVDTVTVDRRDGLAGCEKVTRI